MVGEVSVGGVVVVVGVWCGGVGGAGGGGGGGGGSRK